MYVICGINCNPSALQCFGMELWMIYVCQGRYCQPVTILHNLSLPKRPTASVFILKPWNSQIHVTMFLA